MKNRRLSFRTRAVLTAAVLIPALVGVSPAARAAARSSAKPKMTTYACSFDVTFYSTGLNATSASKLCERLERTRKEFNDVFNGGEPMSNAEGDLTAGVDFYVYRNNAEYVRGGRQHDYETSASDSDDNAGIMFERDPLAAGNRAFVATRAFGADMTDITNLEHEFVHYLTFRYLAPADLDLPLWFAEGLADNLGNPQHFDDAREVTIDEQYALSEILQNTETTDQDLVYNAGHMAVEYFLVARPAETGSLAEAIDRNDTEAIEEWTESIGDRLDADFASWLSNY